MHQVTKYATQETLENEQQVKAFIQQVWGVEIWEREHYNPIDWDVRLGDQQVGCIELKTYNRTADDSPTVIMNLRKYIALRDQYQAVLRERPNTQYKALYMVNFLDQIRYIDVMDVSTAFPQMGGQRGGPRSTDWEPVYKVPVASMKLLAKKGTPNG
jgi:hypothetical protein